MRAALVISLLFVAACGRQDPDMRHPDWQANFDRARQASASGQHEQAIGTAEAFLNRHPDNVDAHQMVGDAYREAAKAVSDARRQERYTQAMAHYTRALEITKNPTRRLQSTVALRDIHRPDALNNPEEQVRYARMLIVNDPKNVHTYAAMLAALKDAKKYDDAVAVLAETKRAIEPTVDALAAYAYMAHGLVVTPGVSPDTGRKILTETIPVIDEALRMHGPSEKLLSIKALLFGAQADLETDPARQRALNDESIRIQKEADQRSR